MSLKYEPALEPLIGPGALTPRPPAHLQRENRPQMLHPDPIILTLPLPLRPLPARARNFAVNTESLLLSWA